ncbi:MAG: hypothetical protein LC799_31250 [Actinobacteria bacterium]|nr:hypothetical protein [Actinomycetota bacterium]
MALSFLALDYPAGEFTELDLQALGAPTQEFHFLQRARCLRLLCDDSPDRRDEGPLRLGDPLGDAQPAIGDAGAVSWGRALLHYGRRLARRP